MKKRYLFFLSLFFLFILIRDSFALGLSPDKTTINFSPYGEGSVRITVINTENRDIVISPHFSGDFAKYFSVIEKKILVEAGKGRIFSIFYKFPAKVDPPGLNSVEVRVIEEIPKVGGISAAVSVISKIIIDVPYPGKYVAYEVSGNSVNLGENIKILYYTVNRGLEHLFQVRSYTDFYFSSNKEDSLISKKSKSYSLEMDERKESFIIFNSSELGIGEYFVDVYLVYDQVESSHRNITINVGHEYVGLINYTKELNVGGVRKFYVTLMNKWNSYMDNVYFDVVIQKDGVPVNPLVISQSENFEPWQKKKIPIYVDTELLDKGDYEAVINIYYAGKKTEETVDIKLVDVFILDISVVIIIIIALLILADVIWMYFYRKSHKEPKTRESKLNKL